MCELDDLDEFARRSRDLTRRQFGAMALGAGIMAALPKLANAAQTQGTDVEIKTPDGDCDAYFVHPTAGKYPGVLIWPDIFGLRPAFKAMATRLAESGYSVLVINPFYRTKKAPTAPEHPDFDDPATRQTLLSLMGTLTPETAVTDARAFVSYLDNQPSVDGKRNIAIAENDDKREPQVKVVLRDEFAKAHLPAEIEVYAGTLHGWCPPDGQVYNHDQAEKAWSRTLALFSSSLA